MIKSGHIKRSASGVPILSHDQIDGLEEQLAGDFQPDLLTCPQELDIESFIEFYMGLKLDFKFLSSCGKYLGMTVFNDTDKVIFYDPARTNADYMHVGAGTVIIDSTLLTPKKEHRMVARYNEIFRVQLPNITPHVCRHTYCSNMARSGMRHEASPLGNPKALQYLMGHSEMGVTLNTYTHLGLEDAVDEIRKMEEERARQEIERGNRPQKEARLTQRMFRVV